jgi:hypothetical protein
MKYMIMMKLISKKNIDLTLKKIKRQQIDSFFFEHRSIYK